MRLIPKSSGIMIIDLTNLHPTIAERKLFEFFKTGIEQNTRINFDTGYFIIFRGQNAATLYREFKEISCYLIWTWFSKIKIPYMPR